MITEYEARILEINKEEFIKKLESLNAKKISDYNQRRYVYNFSPIIEGKWIRLRDNGKTTTLTIKEIKNDDIDGTKELEIEVSDFEKTNTILNELGYKSYAYQENKRTRYMLNDIEIDIDSWPMIPDYVEFEGKNEEEIISLIKKLGYKESDVTTLGVSKIYKHYGIIVEDIPILKFD